LQAGDNAGFPWARVPIPSSSDPDRGPRMGRRVARILGTMVLQRAAGVDSPRLVASAKSDADA